MAIPTRASGGDIMEAVLVKGDLAKLTPDERNRYYVEVCKSVGLNPLTQPFAYITLNGKLQLYAKKDATDQLRKINGISVELVSQDLTEGIFTVHARAKDGDGRIDEDLGVVAIPEVMKGVDRANNIMKGVTKAKRRVTLSISGLGLLDETEVEDIPSARGPAPQIPSPAPAPQQEQRRAPVPGPAPHRSPVDDDRRPPPTPMPRPPVKEVATGPHRIDLGGIDADVWAAAYIKAIGTATTGSELHQWDQVNGEKLQRLSDRYPSIYDMVAAAFETRLNEVGAPTEKMDTETGEITSLMPDPKVDATVAVNWVGQQLNDFKTWDAAATFWDAIVMPRADDFTPEDFELVQAELRRAEARLAT